MHTLLLALHATGDSIGYPLHHIPHKYALFKHRMNKKLRGRSRSLCPCMRHNVKHTFITLMPNTRYNRERELRTVIGKVISIEA